MESDLASVYPQGLLKKSQIYSLCSQFRQGRTRLSDMLRSGRPRSACTEVNKDLVQFEIDQNKRVGLHNLSSRTGISYGSVERIVRCDLLLKKKCGKSIPHVLTPAQCNRRVLLAQNFLQNTADPRWLKRVITADESWFYLENPRSRLAEMQWMEKGEQRPQIPKRSRTCRKAMLIAFFDCHGLVFRHWILNGTVNTQVYVYVLRQLRLAIRNRRRNLWRNRTQQPYLLHDDNASCHTSTGTVNYQAANGIVRVPHPPYSPDLALCDFFLFSYLKRQIRGLEFATLQELTTHVDDLIGQITRQQWKDVFKDWKHRLKKCIHFHGRYFEGMQHP